MKYGLNNRSLFCATLAITLALAGCGGDSTGTGSAPTLSIVLTDAPGDVAHVWVDIARIELLGSETVVLRDTPTGLIDLVSLQGTGFTVVDPTTVPAGTYTQLRLILGGAVLETDGGEVFSKDNAEHPTELALTGLLNCPSCTPSGLKIKLPGGNVMVEGESRILLLDFDAAQSFGHGAGNSGQWVMHPVIHASEITLTGTILGSVSLAGADTPDPIDDVTVPACDGQPRSVADFVPLATSAGDPSLVKSGTTQTDGSYAISFLDPGTYDMGHEAEIQFTAEKLVFTATASPAQVDVASGGTSAVDNVITGVVCTT